MIGLHDVLHTSLALSSRWAGAVVTVTMVAVAIALLLARTRRLSATSRHRILSIAMLAPVIAALLAASGLGGAIKAVVAPASGGTTAATIVGATSVVMSAEPRVDWICLFFALWAGVAVLFGLRWFVRALAWSRIARDATPVADARLLRPFERLASRFANPPAFELAPAATEPMVIGLFRPTLLLPTYYGSEDHRLPDDEISAVLTHELEHVRRRDNLGAAAHELVTALFWFSPLHWIARRRLLELRERACDERVLEHGCEAESYVAALARTCHTAIECPAIACMSGFQIRERIESIMRYPADRSRFASENIVRMTALAAAVALVVAFGVLAPQPSIAAMAAETKDAYALQVQVGPAKDGRIFVGIAVKSPTGKSTHSKSIIAEGGPVKVELADGKRILKVDVPFAAVGQLATLEVLEGNAVVARAKTRVESVTRYLPEPPPPPPPGYVRVGGDVKEPKVISRVDPKYTEEGRSERIQGITIIEALIDESGKVVHTTIVKDLPNGLGQAAADAISQWRFEPATKNGKPVAVVFNVTVNFKLDGDKPK